MEYIHCFQPGRAIGVPVGGLIIASAQRGSCNHGWFCDLAVADPKKWRTRTALRDGECWVGSENAKWSSLLNSRQQLKIRRRSRISIPVMNAVRPDVDGLPATEELKTQLASLQEEASQVRDRYNSSRARFMRLAQVAEQLQQRALVDMKLGNEGNARQVLMEKKKVMRAAELSNRRSQLFEELSSKLSEAISRKETQLMAALSSSPPKTTLREEPPVRVIFPAKESKKSVQGELEDKLQDNFSGTSTDQASPGQGGLQQELESSFSGATTDRASLEEGGFEQELEGSFRGASLDQASFNQLERNDREGNIPVEEAEASVATTDSNTNCRNEVFPGNHVEAVEALVENTLAEYGMGPTLKGEISTERTGYATLPGEGALTTDRSVDTGSAGAVLSEEVAASDSTSNRSANAEYPDITQDAFEVEDFDHERALRGQTYQVEESLKAEEDAYLEENVATYLRDEQDQLTGTDGAGGGGLNVEEVKETANAGINEEVVESHRGNEETLVKAVEESLNFDQYLLDIDTQMAGVESKLQSLLMTAETLLDKRTEVIDDMVVLVKQLLEHVQILRSRVSEGLTKSSRQKMP